MVLSSHFENAKIDTRVSGVDLKALIEHIRKHHMKLKEEIKVLSGSVRPWIIVMINDCDWELEGGLDYEVQDKDVIAFISTLHGG